MQVTDNNVKQLSIYETIGNRPILRQIIAMNRIVSSVRLSRDHQVLVVAEEGYSIHIYHFN